MNNNYFDRTLRRTFDISGIDISDAGVKRLSDSTEFCYACYPIVEILKVLKGPDWIHLLKEIEYLRGKITRACGWYTVNVYTFVGTSDKHIEFKLYPDQIAWISITFALRGDNRLEIVKLDYNEEAGNFCYFENTHLALFIDAVYSIYDTLFTAIDYEDPLIK